MERLYQETRVIDQNQQTTQEELESVKRGKSLTVDVQKEAEQEGRSDAGDLVKQLLKAIKSNAIIFFCC